MARDPDANPLHSKEEDGFLEEMLEHVERRATVSNQPASLPDRAALVANLDKRMQQADWYYDYSDDPSVWRKGLEEMRGIQNDLYTLSVQPNGLQEARQLWELHTKPHSVSPPDFLQHPPEQRHLSVSPTAIGEVDSKVVVHDQLQVSSRYNKKSMTIEGEEVAGMLRKLDKAQYHGLRYVGIESGADKLHPDKLIFFNSKANVDYYDQHWKPHEQHPIQVVSVQGLHQFIQRAAELQSIAYPKQDMPKDVQLDVAFFAKQETARQQIFFEELQQQLIKQGFDSSVGPGLKAGIDQDLVQFEIDAVRTLNGKEEWYTVKVEQNHDRAFQIGSIMPELEGRMEKINWKHAYYDPLEQNVEAESPEDKLLVRQIWKVVDDIQDLAQSGPYGLNRATALEHKYWKGTPMEGTVATLIDNNLKETVMSEQVNDKNFEYLSKQLKMTGFGEGLQPALKEAMQKGEKEFTLGHVPDFAKDHVAATLHFKKSDTSELYFFNKFNVVVKNDQFPDAAKQSFEIYNNSQQDNVTLKQAYNLLEGRAIHRNMTTKEGEPYSAWQQLNFNKTTPNGNFEVKQYHQNYGFDLEKTLAKYPIQELQNEKYKESLIKSLERGNLQSVTLLRDGNEEKVFITPNLAFKSLAFHDAEGKRLSQQVLFPKAEDGAYMNQDNALKKGQKEGLNGNSQVAGESGQQVKTEKQGQAMDAGQRGKSETAAQAKETGSNTSQKKGLKEALGVNQSVGEKKQRTRKQG